MEKALMHVTMHENWVVKRRTWRKNWEWYVCDEGLQKFLRISSTADRLLFSAYKERPSKEPGAVVLEVSAAKRAFDDFIYVNGKELEVARPLANHVFVLLKAHELKSMFVRIIPIEREEDENGNH